MAEEQHLDPEGGAIAARSVGVDDVLISENQCPFAAESGNAKFPPSISGIDLNIAMPDPTIRDMCPSPVDVFGGSTNNSFPDCTPDPASSVVQHISDQEIVVPGWKKRNIGARGPDTRTPPSINSAIERRLLEMNNGTGLEIFEPVQGTTFDSRQEAYDFYNLYSWEHGFGIRHGKSRINVNKYMTMHEMVCQCEGKIRKENNASCKTECKALVRLLRTKDHGWYVCAFVKEHNHKLSIGYEQKIQWNSHNDIDPIACDFIRNLRNNNISVSKVYNILGGGEGPSSVVPCRKQVLRTLCAKFSQQTIKDDLTKTMLLLQQMKSEDRNLKVEIDVDCEGRVRTMLWSTWKNRLDYVHFGDVVTFDTTYKTNLYNMPFGLFVGVNNHFQSVIFGGVVMREETEVAFNWVFKTFVGVMNDKHPVTILTDQAQAMKGAIETTLPQTRHRWCKWHVLRDAKENLGNVYSKYSGFKREFHSLINDVMCIDDFEAKWANLVRKYKLAKNDYMSRLYDKREMWAKPYFKGIFCAGMTSTQRSESANHMLKQYIERSSPMHVFVRQYNKFLSSRSDEVREIHVKANKTRSYESTFPIEDDAASIYTRIVLSKFQDELYKCGSYVVTIVEPGVQYKVGVAASKVKDADNRKWCNVKIEENGQYISCDCGMFDHIGMLCRHSMKVLIREDFLKIPAKNIMKRWTIWAAGNYPSGMDMPEKKSSKDDTSYLKNLLYIAVEDLLKESARGNNTLRFAIESVGKLTSAIRNMPTQNDDTAHQQSSEGDGHVNIQMNTVLAPERVKKNGRPSVRPKSKMDRVAEVHKKKTKTKKPAAGNNATPSTTNKTILKATKSKTKKPTTHTANSPNTPKECPLTSLYDPDLVMMTPDAECVETVSPDIPSKKRKDVTRV